MSIVAEAEKNQVVLINWFAVLSGNAVELLFVLVRGDFRINFAPHSHDRFLRNGGRRKKIFARHSEVALRIVRGHAPLVSKREANFIPRKIMGLGCNSRVHGCRRVPARECNPELVALSNSFVRLLENESRSVSDEILCPNDVTLSFHTKGGRDIALH